MSRRHKNKNKNHQQPQPETKGQTMQVTKNANTFRQLKEIPGLFSCLLTHNVAKTEAKAEWSGPPLPPDEWRAMLAFFKWTYDTMKSESQVRWYVNPQLKVWRCWALPQEAKTGMSAHELPNHANTAIDRAQFPDTEGWHYFGTIHHHCSMGAFQSGADQNNEQNQDGLHITIGNLDAAKYSLHARLYLAGHEFNPDMSLFWDIGDALALVPASLLSLLPSNTKDLLAREQMVQPPDATVTFPERWRENVIEIKPEPSPVTVYRGGLGGHSDWPDSGSFWDNRDSWCAVARRDLALDKRRAMGDITGLLRTSKTLSMDGVVATLRWLEAQCEDETLEIIAIMLKNDLMPGSLADHIEELEMKAELAAQQQEAQKSPDKTEGKGTPALTEQQIAEAYGDYKGF